MSSMKRNMVLLALCVVLALSALACGGGGDLVTGMQDANKALQDTSQVLQDTGMLVTD